MSLLSRSRRLLLRFMAREFGEAGRKRQEQAPANSNDFSVPPPVRKALRRLPQGRLAGGRSEEERRASGRERVRSRLKM